MAMPKLVSNRFMESLNAEFDARGRAPISKKTFMAMLAILSRFQRAQILEQFDSM